MKKLFTLAALVSLLGAVPAQAALVDLSTWTPQIYNLPGGQGNASWTLSGGNTVATQTVNADPSMLRNNIDQTNYTMEGSWSVQTTSDDDFMGFIFGYQDVSHFYIMDWKKGTQNTYGGVAQAGFSVKKIAANSFNDLTLGDFWISGDTTNSTLLDSHYDSNGWASFTEYDFRLDFTPGEFDILVKQGDTVLWDTTVLDNSYTSGEFGFYNFSQGNVRYSGFREEIIIPDPTPDPTPGTAAIPEPATMALMGAGFGMMGFARRRRKQ